MPQSTPTPPLPPLSKSTQPPKPLDRHLLLHSLEVFPLHPPICRHHRLLHPLQLYDTSHLHQHAPTRTLPTTIPIQSTPMVHLLWTPIRCLSSKTPTKHQLRVSTRMVLLEVHSTSPTQVRPTKHQLTTMAHLVPTTKDLVLAQHQHPSTNRLQL